MHILGFLQNRYNFSTQDFLKNAKIENYELKQQKIDAKYLSILFEEAIKHTKDENLSFKLGEWANPHSLGILGYLLLHSKNIYETVQKLCRYYQLIGSTLKPVLTETKNKFKLSFYIKSENSLISLGRQQCEIHFSATMALLNKIAINQVLPEYVTFIHKKPDDISEYVKFFGKKLYFSELENALVFSKEALAINTAYQNSTLLEMFEKEAQKILEQSFSGTLKDEVFKTIFTSIDSFEFSLEETSKKLSMHPRVLQKKLQSEGTSYNDILSDVRVKLAKHYLSKDMDSTTIAISLGYSELSAFIRAFKKQVGVTPREWKNSLES